MLLKYLFVKTDEPIDLVDLNFFIVHFIGPLNGVIGSNIAWKIRSISVTDNPSRIL